MDELKLFEEKLRPLSCNMDWAEFKLGPDGLVPVVVQDYRTDEVLMAARIRILGGHNQFRSLLSYFLEDFINALVKQVIGVGALLGMNLPIRLGGHHEGAGQPLTGNCG